MANREVNLTKRVQTPHGWRYCRVLLSANGRRRAKVPQPPTSHDHESLTPTPLINLNKALCPAIQSQLTPVNLEPVRKIDEPRFVPETFNCDFRSRFAVVNPNQ